MNSERLYRRSRHLLRVGSRKATVCLFVAPPPKNIILPTPSKVQGRAEPVVLLECLAYIVNKVLVPLKDGGESK
jgi:hypothetical protein